MKITVLISTEIGLPGSQPAKRSVAKEYNVKHQRRCVITCLSEIQAETEKKKSLSAGAIPKSYYKKNLQNREKTENPQMKGALKHIIE